MSERFAWVAGALRLNLLKLRVNLLQPVRQPRRRTSRYESCNAFNAGIDIDSAILEEIVVSRFSIPLCRRGDSPQVIARIARSAQRRVGSPILRLLLTPAFACNLHVAASQR